MMHDFVDQSAKHMADIINMLVNQQYLEKSEIKLTVSNFKIHNLISECIKNWSISAQSKDIDIVFSQSDQSDDLISSDSQLLYQVIDNLISNALKYSYSNSQITIDLVENNDEVLISIADQGMGIKPEELKFLFINSKKITNKPTAGESSTRLGLDIVKQFVELLKGSIHVESEVGKGTTFKISIPKNIQQGE